jgi:5-methylcytosine-specific restriction endonuclease McrA
MRNKKSKLQSEADKLWYNKLLKPVCEVCGKKALQVHHFYYKGSFGHLRYDEDNGISLCQGCHFLIHHKDPKPITKIIIEKRGQKWADELETKSKKRLSSFKTVSYYLSIIEKLKK